MPAVSSADSASRPSAQRRKRGTGDWAYCGLGIVRGLGEVLPGSLKALDDGGEAADSDGQGEGQQQRVDPAVHPDAHPAEDAPEAVVAPDDETFQRRGETRLGQQVRRAQLADHHRVVPASRQNVHVAVDRGVAHVPGQGDQQGGRGDEEGVKRET